MLIRTFSTDQDDKEVSVNPAQSLESADADIVNIDQNTDDDFSGKVM